MKSSNQGDFDTLCPLLPPTTEDMKQWDNNILNYFCAMKSNPEYDYVIYTDARTKGGGAHDNTHTINGRWSDCEAQSHINILKLPAIKIVTSSFFPLKEDMKHVKIITYNSTTMSCINKQGGVKSMTCNNSAK